MYEVLSESCARGKKGSSTFQLAVYLGPDAGPAAACSPL